ncbi:glucose/galactose transporter [Citrifermentans bemidjiense Bem]|uniref:Glucose/galactose transporter n=1 Tax=Citrifermentans bemidjiense (strain ATCC BAA-1014 / DSM 16622 / JCM 12645 / Bem) TaxID=404380 RepID=B5EDN5_CITBB|nr:sugar MFS transporter [Citrifermentans bemidjiense]ACH40663.1 glucose/galactose transporter [Citrifermentans bemidjiense Bem]
MGGVVPTTAKPKSSPAQGDFSIALIALTFLFFAWGFITCLNDILIPHLKSIFALNYTQSMLIQFCFFAAYFLMSLPSGAVIEKIGYQKGICAGLVVAASGCLLFYPSAGLRSYPLFLTGFFVLACGITLLQVAANPYVAILGTPQTAASRLTLTQAFNALGTAVAPYLGSIFILGVAVKPASDISGMAPAELALYRAAEAGSVQVPYLWMAAVLCAMAAVFSLVRLPEVEPGTSDPETGKEEYDPGSAWGYRHLKLGALGIFLYVGAEVAIGSFLVNYLGQPYVKALPEASAARYVSFYWGGAMVGRFIGSALQRLVNPARLLACNALVTATLTAVTMLTTGSMAMWAILLIGLFNSIMFPTIFSLAIAGLGRHTGKGSGIICMAIVGGAIIPLLQGGLADVVGLHHAFILPLMCYLYIAYYGLAGHKPRLSAPR